MEYNVSKDVNIMRILLDLSQEDLANILGVDINEFYKGVE